MVPAHLPSPTDVLCRGQRSQQTGITSRDAWRGPWKQLLKTAGEGSSPLLSSLVLLHPQIENIFLIFTLTASEGLTVRLCGITCLKTTKQDLDLGGGADLQTVAMRVVPKGIATITIFMVTVQWQTRSAWKQQPKSSPGMKTQAWRSLFRPGVAGLTDGCCCRSTLTGRRQKLRRWSGNPLSWLSSQHGLLHPSPST